MIRILSESGIYYEYDSSTPIIEEEQWVSAYHGFDSLKNKVIIYITRLTKDLPDYLQTQLREKVHVKYYHPNIIPIIDFFKQTSVINGKVVGTQYVFIGDSYEGMSLQEVIQKRPSTDSSHMYKMYVRQRTKFVINVIRETLKGIEFLHSMGWHLGMIDTSNIIFTNDGKIKICPLYIYLMEIMRKTSYMMGDGSDRMYLPGTFPYYEATELYYGIIDCRTDIYSAGVLLYKIMTGKIPSPCSCVRNDFICDIRDKHLAGIVECATQKVPNKRYQSASEFIKALDDYMNTRSPFERVLSSMFNYFHNT